ncbi:MAG: CopG family transcriptional regulator [Spirochaetaceae bacterium]|jgi:hypothetical protein|nr:CopG family transcriptional regulator [Spirochaetaceae bacterium]
MNKRIVYTKAPEDISKDIFEGEMTDDFLPPPEQLVRKEGKVKITIALNAQSVNFFKRYAEKHKISNDDK